VAKYTAIAFLWHNVVGAVVVILAGMAISLAERNGAGTRTA